MRIVVVYESMFGNTHDLADAIAMALAPAHEVTTVPVGSANRHTLDGADLVLVGGPTHAHGESWPKTRAAARQQAERDHLTLDPDAGGQGLREWLDGLGHHESLAAAFDTRLDARPVLTGRASKGIDRALRHHGFRVVVDPMSFLVTSHNTLVDGEAAHAGAWGTAVAETAVGAMASSP